MGISLQWQLLKPYNHFYSHNKPSLEYYLNLEGLFGDIKRGENLPKDVLYHVYKVYQAYEDVKREAINNGLKILNGDKFSKFDVFTFEK